MKQTCKQNRLPIVTVVLGCCALILRRVLYAVAVDVKNLLPVNHPLEIVLWVLTAIAAAWIIASVWKLDGSAKYEDNFQPSLMAAVGHYIAAAGILLTVLLLDTLRSSRATVINTSSDASFQGRLDLEDPGLGAHWSGWRAYSQAKLANVLFTRELHRRHGAAGVSAAAFHPGVVATNFGADAGRLTRWFYSSRLGKALMISPEAGADTLVWLAEATPAQDWQPGLYYVKRAPKRPNPLALDADLARRLWDDSATLVGV